LNAGFISAEINISGNNIAINFNAFLPFKIIEYITLHKSDVTRHIGCTNIIENTITAVKYIKLING